MDETRRHTLWRRTRPGPFGTAGLLLLVTSFSAATAAAAGAEAPVNIGSKAFTESVILGEVVTQLSRARGATDVHHRRELGGTRIVFNALLRGDVDAYPEYTGTVMQEILAGRDVKDEQSMRAALAAQGVAVSRPLGFNNTYAIGMRAERAESLGIRTISELAEHPELPLGFSSEFLDRADCWPALRRVYAFASNVDVRGLQHDLAYRALEDGSIAATDLYSTDAEIAYYKLRVLEDDRRCFPEYRAVFLYRADLAQRTPAVVDAIRALEGRIDERRMIAMNRAAKLDRVPDAQVAATFLADQFSVRPAPATGNADLRWRRIAKYTRQHLTLVGISLAAAIVTGVPLGVLAQRTPRIGGQAILGLLGVIYTIPSLALLVFMIRPFGIGMWPAIVALYLYSLLPIVRNTHAGLQGIPTPLRESAVALGLPALARLRLIELPLALGSILAGIKTAAIINVGTATLGALIGAGGYGEPILAGIRLDNFPLIFEGAIPAAALALLVQAGFEAVERFALPRGLRPRSSR
jgi:osmoprotectant transport system permease protein